MKKQDFSKATRTIKGNEVKKIEWNSCANLYLGSVADPIWARPDRPYTTCSWTKAGKCVNRTRPDLDLT